MLVSTIHSAGATHFYYLCSCIICSVDGCYGHCKLCQGASSDPIQSVPQPALRCFCHSFHRSLHPIHRGSLPQLRLLHHHLLLHCILCGGSTWYVEHYFYRFHDSVLVLVSFGLVYPQFEDLQHVEVEGVWQIVFSTFLVYSMLPLR